MAGWCEHSNEISGYVIVGNLTNRANVSFSRRALLYEISL
jgi:hypothetical protein